MYCAERLKLSLTVFVTLVTMYKRHRAHTAFMLWHALRHNYRSSTSSAIASTALVWEGRRLGTQIAATCARFSQIKAGLHGITFAMLHFESVALCLTHFCGCLRWLLHGLCSSTSAKNLHLMVAPASAQSVRVHQYLRCGQCLQRRDDQE